MVRLCGAALGSFAFAITILLGLSAGNPADVTILRAVQAMIVFCIIGLLVGWVAARVLDEHTLGRHRELFAEEKEQAQEPAGEGSSGEDGTDAGPVPAVR